MPALAAIQEVPSSVASEQLRAALNADIGTSPAVRGQAGVPFALVFLGVVILLVTGWLALMWLRSRRRVEDAPQTAGVESEGGEVRPPEAHSREPGAVRREAGGRQSAVQQPDPDPGTAAPQHLLEALARRRAELGLDRTLAQSATAHAASAPQAPAAPPAPPASPSRRLEDPADPEPPAAPRWGGLDVVIGG